MGPMILKNILLGGRASIDNGNAVSPIPSKYVCSANLRSFEHEQEVQWARKRRNLTPLA